MIIKKIPADSRCYDTLTFFNAAFNVPTPGVYDFTNTAANNGVAILAPIHANAIYMIEQLGFSATVPEAAYLEAVQVQTTLSLRKAIDGQSILARPIPCLKYTEGAGTVQYFWTQAGNSQVMNVQDQLLGDFRGVLIQPPALVGVAAIRVAIAIRIYEIISRTWIINFKARNPMV